VIPLPAPRIASCFWTATRFDCEYTKRVAVPLKLFIGRSNMTPSINTPLTRLLGIEKPILLAGMNVAAGPELAAAVSKWVYWVATAVFDGHRT
jgi:hypothetical protein